MPKVSSSVRKVYKNGLAKDYKSPYATTLPVKNRKKQLGRRYSTRAILTTKPKHSIN